MTRPVDRILSDLRRAAASVRKAEDSTDAALARRDELIVEAADALGPGTPKEVVALAAGVSKLRVYQVLQKAQTG